MGNRVVEDETFKYGGYAKVTVADITVGDGIRWGDQPFACWNVLACERIGDIVELVTVDRAVANDEIVGRLTGKNPEATGTVALPVTVHRADEPVWVRL
jgi:hypothetical protein